MHVQVQLDKVGTFLKDENQVQMAWNSYCMPVFPLNNMYIN